MLLSGMERKNKPTKPDKIELYSQPDSQAFAPLTRLGVFPDRGAERFKVDSPYLNTYAGMFKIILHSFDLHNRKIMRNVNKTI